MQMCFFPNPMALESRLPLIAEGMGFVIQSPLAIGSQQKIPLRSLRLCGEPDFPRGQGESKNPIKSTEARTISI